MQTPEFRTLPHNIKVYRDGTVEQDGKVLKNYVSGGRYTTNIFDGVSKRWVATHRIIAEAWIGDTKGKFVLFRDGSKQNLSVDNLEVVTTRAAGAKVTRAEKELCPNG